MPEEKREAKNAWVTTQDGRARFWATANELGLTKDEAHQALNFVESCYDFTGTLDEALVLIARYAEMKIEAARRVAQTAQSNALFTMAAQLPEAPALAWTKFQKQPDSPTWSITLRAGLPPKQADEATREVLRQITTVEKWLKDNKFRPVYHGSEMAASPVPAPAQRRPAKAKGATPPPPTGAGNGSPPPPPPSGSTPPPPGQNGNGNNFEIQTEFVKVTAPKGKAVIEFWRPNRKYYEIRYQLGGEAFLKLAPTLAEAGWEAAHFDAVGEEYTLALAITWEPSKPDGKYKDITAVAVRF